MERPAPCFDIAAERPLPLFWPIHSGSSTAGHVLWPYPLYLGISSSANALQKAGSLSRVVFLGFGSWDFPAQFFHNAGGAGNSDGPRVSLVSFWLDEKKALAL